MTVYADLLQKLQHGNDPYAGFPSVQWAGAWYGDPGAQREIFIEAIKRSNPGIIVEVGSFVGESAVFMANHLQDSGRDACVICVDTWYGGVDHYLGAPEKINNWFGRPDLYYRFMSNVIARGQTQRILPLAMDSINGARLLKLLGIVPSMVYVDGSHEAGDVLRDYEAYWQLLPEGGAMLVDDLSRFFPGVVLDWEMFIDRHKLKPIMIEGEKGLLVK